MVTNSPYSQTNNIYIFSSKTSVSHSNAYFIERTKLESSYVKDDCFKIRCDVTVIKDIDAEDTTVETVTMPPADLHRHLGDLLDSQVGGDMTFNVNGDLFTPHRYMLAARSSVFMAQFFVLMKEKTVRIDDMDARVFKVMLRFMHTDMLPTDMEEDEKTGGSAPTCGGRQIQHGEAKDDL
jgi:speckle-type POZ protein